MLMLGDQRSRLLASMYHNVILADHSSFVKQAPLLYDLSLATISRNEISGFLREQN